MDNAATVLVIHGPNLNMLGTREPEVYGSDTLEDIDRRLVEKGRKLRLAVETFHSNHEGAIVDRIQEAAAAGVAGVIINPAAYTHTSVAIRDALLLLSCPIVEVHLSNVYKREAFRHKSYVSDIAAAVMAGFGARGYELALEGLAGML
ncbi:MAG: type II 3-dehydroquinate dehydratase [Deltaproteobacteria bacterium]|nr:type II 3-dehydroquinate dehydratase [Deltaproteobacteria bacterium]